MSKLLYQGVGCFTLEDVNLIGKLFLILPPMLFPAKNFIVSYELLNCLWHEKCTQENLSIGKHAT